MRMSGGGLDRVGRSPVIQNDGYTVRVVQLLHAEFTERLADEICVLMGHQEIRIGLYDLSRTDLGCARCPSNNLLSYRPSSQRYANSTWIFNHDFQAVGGAPQAPR